MIVEDLVKQGAWVDIRFHKYENLQEAYEKLKPFNHLGKIRRGNRDGSYWLEIESGKTCITAFYKNQTKN